MADAAQLLRGRHARRTRPDDGHAAAGLALGRLRLDPALLPGAVDDRVLDLLDRDGVALADLQHARGLAWRRAQAAGELGEVVRGVQLDDRVGPALAVDEVVPVGDQVAERAAAVTERHAALHAARALGRQLVVRTADEELLEVVRALVRVAVRHADALDLQECPELTHRSFLPTLSRERPRSLPVLLADVRGADDVDGLALELVGPGRRRAVRARACAV